ncbi:PBSX family phage terminase large subunit [Sulfuricurvum sp. MLSB]|jgi:PBSX family phage terminase large subunit|uniref:PBSX family phage terminase large subunit n=1 Tax=Sulfuricurvum sp. MLSB TaxID=1537917 RepID=UPI000B18F434|nr:PBSX family phage terminase large subunit [Sulfuricurvum sp. MLSB]
MNLIANYQPLFYNPPETRYYLITGGRGSAKSFHASLFLLNLTYEPNEIILFTRWTMVSAQISIIPEFIEKIELMNLENDFDVKQNEIVNKKTGSKILFKGIKTSQGTATANLKSISGVTCFVLDEAEELVDEDIFDKIDLSIRAKNKYNRVIMIMNPSNKQHWIYKNWIEKERPNTTFIHTTYLDNIQNLSDSFLQQAETVKNHNLDRFNHLFMGDWIEDSEGILWNTAIINRAKIKVKPDNLRCVVAIDPATTATKNSDETGIIVVGYADDKYYILDDLSGRYSPTEWAKVAHQAFVAYGCDYYVAEKNQGGDMVKAVLANQDANNLIKLVTATKGKFTRAEPIYQLYENNKVFHVGDFPILERQMVTFNPDKNTTSPDRVDALVWGVTELSAKSNVDLFLY